MDDRTAPFEEFKPGTRLTGIVNNESVTVIAATRLGSTVDLTYTTSSGVTKRELLDQDSLSNIGVADGQLPFKFDADPEEFRLAAEALRIKYAGQYDPMSAVYSSNIDPLPHQIRAVYEDMLPMVPLRFLLADDPGAGKTVMAGLYIKEMLLRSAAERVIIVCPGGLAEQWQDELSDKFSLSFEIFAPQTQLNSQTSNPFLDHSQLIVRMDQVARDDNYRAMLHDAEWDIAVVDEAHRMSAHYANAFGKVEATKRFRLGQTLAETAENLLLMTATPHSGKEDDFQLFMSLLDKDRFEGRYDPNKHGKIDTKGLMRRMVKEDLLTFDGKPLFPERRAETVFYDLSDDEASLYQAVTTYVRSGMNAAKRLIDEDGSRSNNIGFALTILQRRLASSPQAIYQSLVRRQKRLKDTLDALKHNPGTLNETWNSNPEIDTELDTLDDLWDETSESSQATLELQLNQVVDSATASRTAEELSAEIDSLGELIRKAGEVRTSGRDSKWSQLSEILHAKVLDAGTSEQPHKMIIFTEHKDTLNYLKSRISTLLGQSESVNVIHGGMSRKERKIVENQFMQDPKVRILVATDAAGEGLNLQRADLMVNYDLPWNPNRIEQRFGRIHRIGQKRVCYLWNLVAENTREGEVYGKLLKKIDTMDQAYSGRLFNVLGDGQAFEGRPLKDLMLEAIQYGDDPQVQQKLDEIVDNSVSKGLDDLISERSVHPERYTKVDVDEVRRLMEKTRERKLQPGYISAFFVPALKKLNGGIQMRETNRWEVTHVPPVVRDRAQKSNNHKPIPNAYERITFDTSRIHLAPEKPDAELISPGTPLLDAVCDTIIDQYGQTLDMGTIFIDNTDSQPSEPTLMMTVQQTLLDNHDRVISQHFDYLQYHQSGEIGFSPAPPYLDYDKPTETDSSAISEIIDTSWIQKDHSTNLQDYIYEHGTKPRLEELRERRRETADHTRKQVETRLKAEIDYWFNQYWIRKESKYGTRPNKAGRDPMSAFKRARSAEERLTIRQEELSKATRIKIQPAIIRSAALVIPSHLIGPETVSTQSRLFAKDTEEVDQRAVALTMQMERAIGRNPIEMPHDNKGYDIRSTDKHGCVYFIEVKGRIDLPEADTFTVTANEVAFAKTQEDRHRLALVRVSREGPDQDTIRYVMRAFDGIELSYTTRSVNETFADYWKRGSEPC